MVNGGSPDADSITSPEYVRRLATFNQLRPPFLSGERRLAVVSWSDPVSAAEELMYDELDNAAGSGLELARAAANAAGAELQVPLDRFLSGSLYWGDDRASPGDRASLQASARASRRGSVVEEKGDSKRARPLLINRLKRLLTFDSVACLLCLNVAADLSASTTNVTCASKIACRLRGCTLTSTSVHNASSCDGAGFTSKRPSRPFRFDLTGSRTKGRETDLSLLQKLLEAASTSNDLLRKYHDSHQELIHELAEKCQIAVDIEEAVSSADASSLDTDALVYEAGSFDVQNLWRQAQGPRQRVFTIRQRVFGVSDAADRRGRFARSKAHGRFNRVQRTLDGKERLVDWMGRTESEVEEESDLPEIMPDEGRDDVSLGGHEEDRPKTPTPGPMPVQPSPALQQKASSGWLLTLFTQWGSVLGVRTSSAEKHAPAAETHDEKHDAKSEVHSLTETNANSSTVQPSPVEQIEYNSPETFHDAKSSQSLETTNPLAANLGENI